MSGKHEKKASPWIAPQGEPQDEVHPADLDENVYMGMLESDDRKLTRAIAAARLIQTPTPPQVTWPTCWACGQRVPLLFRDRLEGFLVCRRCLWTSVQHEMFETLSTILTGLAKRFGLPVDVETSEDEPEGEEQAEGDEPEVEEQVEDKGDEQPEGDEGAVDNA